MATGEESREKERHWSKDTYSLSSAKEVSSGSLLHNLGPVIHNALNIPKMVDLILSDLYYKRK